MEMLIVMISLTCLVFTGTSLIKELIKEVKEKGFKARWEEVKEEEVKEVKGWKFFHLLFKLVCKIIMVAWIIATAVLVVVGYVKKIIG